MTGAPFPITKANGLNSRCGASGKRISGKLLFASEPLFVFEMSESRPRPMRLESVSPVFPRPISVAELPDASANEIVAGFNSALLLAEARRK